MAERRLGTETSTTRAALLDAAAELMREGGHASVTSRRLAARAAVKPQLVHYYFRTMDELFVALLHRIVARMEARQAEAARAARPLTALWALITDPTDVVLTSEILALSNHRKTISAEIAAFGDAWRRGQREIIAAAFARVGEQARTEGLSPAVLAVLAELVARGLVQEEALGMSEGHGETRAAIAALIERIEPKPQQTPREQMPPLPQPLPTPRAGG